MNYKKIFNKIYMVTIYLFSLSLLNINIYASSNTPIGTWRTIDDTTGRPKSIVEIKRDNSDDNKIIGKVKQILYLDDGGDLETKRCEKCTGDNQNKLIKGMTILWDLVKDGDEWNSGNILDPKSGSIYSVKLTMNDTGDKLNVRGYLGFSLLGRTQVWERVN